LGPPAEDRRVLDVCCGGGLSGLALAEAGWQVHGVDISADQLRLAAPRLVPWRLGIAATKAAARGGW
jgi:methylase of polypeptide subunit release factors